MLMKFKLIKGPLGKRNRLFDFLFFDFATWLTSFSGIDFFGFSDFFSQIKHKWPIFSRLFILFILQ
eukprot:UN07092